jgi:hypothetical protein
MVTEWCKGDKCKVTEKILASFFERGTKKKPVFLRFTIANSCRVPILELF